jgi:serine/threonine protein kinase/tetratricopeptide (TPR) repeat protein
MIGRRLSHFRILEQLGEGGMGVVYRAEDEKLGRQVALKVLRSEAVGNEERRLRFLREARAAAAVTHPHIATVHEVDEVDRVVFIAMELVEGETLADRIDGRPLPPRDALRHAIEVSEAMARAHEAGVVHRDLKPDNVIVGADGHVKILDFGLAKLRDEREPASDQMRTVSAEMTRDGHVLGTASYMSPEQARGLPVDHRTDVFSFGVMLYQMYTGRVPFEGPTLTDKLSAILRDSPEPVATHNPAALPELERIVRKCLEKSADDRYQRAEELTVDLRRLRRETESQSVPRLGETGPSPVAAVDGRRRPWPILLAVLGVAALAIGALWLRGGGFARLTAGREGNSIAVLPLQNLKDGSDPERLGRILQELIITDLSGGDDLRVLSSQRLFDIRKELDTAGVAADREVATEVARRAGARTMLTGSLSPLGDGWILTAQLVNVADGSVIDSERIDGDDLYAMVDSLTTRIRDDLGMPADGDGFVQLAVKDKTTGSIDAYKHYVAGVELLNASRFDDAVAELEQAVATDPAFGKAHYKLAIARWWLGGDQAWWVTGDVAAPDEVLRALLESDVKLSERDRGLAEAFLPLVDYDYDVARPRFEALVERYPDDKEAWYGLGEARFHTPGGALIDESIAAFERALELDPSFGLAFSHVSTVYRQRRLYDTGLAMLDKLIARNPGEIGWYTDRLTFLLDKGDREAADAALEQALERFDEPEQQRDLLIAAGWNHANHRRRDLAVETFRRAVDAVPAAQQAEALNGLGWALLSNREAEAALEVFRQGLALETHDPALLNGVSRSYETLQRFDDAASEFERLVEAEPRHTPYYGLWMRSVVMSGDEEEARQVLEAALGQCATSHEKKSILGLAGDAYRQIGDVARALELTRRAVETAEHPEQESDLMLELGELELEAGRPEEAEIWFQRSSEMFGDATVGPLWGLVAVDMELERFDSAVRRAERLVELMPDSSTARARLLSAELAAHGVDAADRVLKTALGGGLKLEFERRELLVEAASAFVEQGHRQRAEELAQRFEGLLDEEPDSWLLRRHAELSLALGRTEAARRALARARAVNPVDWRVTLDEAALDLVLGDPASAARRLRDHLDAGVRHRSARVLLAHAEAARGRYEDAESEARRAVEMNADRQALSLLALVVARDGRAGEGLELAQRALRSHRSWADRLTERYAFTVTPEQAIGIAYMEAGDPRRAMERLEEAARGRPGNVSIERALARARDAI